MPIKGNGERQLKNPSGKRKIEVTVYDKAGLKSEENKKEGMRIFTSIELLPSEKTVSVEKAKNGLPIPEIKQLKEFFDGEDWKSRLYRRI